MKKLLCGVGVSLVFGLSCTTGSDDGVGGGPANGTTTSTSTTAAASTVNTSSNGASSSGSTGTGGTGGADPFACSGEPLPTTAPATLIVGGTAVSKPSGPAQGATFYAQTVGAAGSGPTGPLPTADASGVFAFQVTTDNKPADIFLVGSHMGDLNNYYYPAVPLSEDSVDTTFVFFSQSSMAGIASLANASQPAGKAFMLVEVRDCLGKPVSGAKVTTSPPGTVRYVVGMLPNATATETDASGTAAIFDLPADLVLVNGTVAGVTLREHQVLARGDAITQTALRP